MSRSPRPAHGAASILVVMIAVVLTACASTAPPKPRATTSAPKPTTSATPTTAPVVARVVVDGTGLEVTGASGQTTEIPYSTDAEVATAKLATALGGAPTDATVTTDECYPELAESSWGGLHIFSTADGLTRPESAQFYATADAAKTSTGLPIQTPHGTAVGATKSAALSAEPSAPSFDNGESIDLHYDIVSGSSDGDPAQYYGALAEIVGTKVTSLSAPVYFSRPC